ncbi:MAG: XRE family transcriptional regulator [Caldilinea sp. CFX5]|nr:XRE family transcriptional regulator [Caldilinea sp. CFX5]
MTTETTFGGWLRQQRRRLDWTQAELAQRVGYSVATIRKVERDELRPSKHLAEKLAQVLEVAATQHASLVNFARATPTLAVEPGPPLDEPRRSNLPAQLTPFFGRTAEIVALTQHLTNPTSRLITIVGPGGMGKTRLAQEVAQAIYELRITNDENADQNSHAVNPKFPDGVYFVALAPLRVPEHIVPAIAEAINLRFQADNRLPKKQLLDFLRCKQLLLVLDNFEHLAAGTELILELLQECPDLRLLVTSRERLQLNSEMLFVLESMALPPTATLPDVLSYSAIQLFVETACRLRPTFTVTPTNAQTIVRICQLVGAMPLGIILAAAWVEVLSPDEIVTELRRSFDFLAAELRDLPERQRSMRAVLTQTWQRLTDAEQAIFMRLAVFRGGFTRPAAQNVTGASLRVFGTLVNKSLVQCTPNGRYTIHELLRQFAEAELAAAGQMMAARTAHCTYYTDFLQQREPDLKGHRQVVGLNEIEADFENVRAAWQWAVAQRNYTAIDHALESFYWFCEMRSRFQEGLELLRLAREHLAPLDGEAPHPVWGRLLGRAFGQNMAFFESRSEAKARVELGLALAQQNENQAEIAFCLWRLAVVFYVSEDSIAAIPYFTESLAHYQALDDRFYQGYLLKDLGILYMTLDQSDQATFLSQQSLRLRRETGAPDGLATSLGVAGWLNYNRGHYSEAETYWQESLQLRRTARNLPGNTLFQLAWLAFFNRGDLETLRTLAEEVQRAALAIGDPENKHRSLSMLGLLAGMREEYDTCRQFFQQTRLLNYAYFPFTTSWEQIGLCLAACGLDDLPAARQHLQEILRISVIHQWPPNAAKGLTFAAIIAAKSGQAQRATELLSLVFHHPLSPKGWLGQWPLLTRLRAELEITLTPQGFQTSWNRGEMLDLLATAKEELAALTGAITSGDMPI